MWRWSQYPNIMKKQIKYIKQNGIIVLSSSDNVSIPMIFRNLIGQNFKGKEYCDYINNIAIPEMGLSHGEIEYWNGDELVSKGVIQDINQ